MSNIQPYIILNGTDSRSISGLLISSLPPISKPQVRTQIETVDGRDGDIITPLGFSAYDKVIKIGLTYNYDVDEIIEFFNSEGIVIFSNEPDKYYRYAIYEQIDFERLIRFKTAEVVLHVQPYKFSTTEEPELFDVVSGQLIAVTNEGNTDSRPNLTIIGSGDIDVSLNGSQILSIELEDDQAVIIDSEDMNAYAAQSAIREVITDIQAKQAGSGDPSPSNIREISGFTEANISLNETIYNIAFTDGDDPLTVYGGKLNATTGELTVTHGFVDLGSLSWTKQNTVNSHWRFRAVVSDIKNATLPTVKADILCEAYTAGTANATWGSGTPVIAVNTDYHYVFIVNEDYSDATAFKSSLDGIHLAYELATPIIYQLTPTQINNLLGVNNMYSDTGDITVKHKSNGVIVTDTGSIVSFSAGLDDIEKGVLLNRAITGDYDKIRLIKGVNTFVLTGNAQQFVIDKYSRWI